LILVDACNQQFLGKFASWENKRKSNASVKMIFLGKNVDNSPYFMGKKLEITIFRQH